MKEESEFEYHLRRALELSEKPRLKTIACKAVEIAERRFKTQQKAANWLGGSRRLITYKGRFLKDWYGKSDKNRVVWG